MNKRKSVFFTLLLCLTIMVFMVPGIAHAVSALDGFDPNANYTVLSIVPQKDNGKILIGGWFTTIGGVTRNRIARLNADGSLDTTFNPNASDRVWYIALQADGKMVIGGDFTTIGGVTRNRIARLNADGSLDTTFNPNVNDSVDSIALQEDGKVLIGGKFTSVGGVTRNNIARLNADGSLDTAWSSGAFSTTSAGEKETTSHGSTQTAPPTQHSIPMRTASFCTPSSRQTARYSSGENSRPSAG
ncbi:MAG: hypothetical protein H6Q52_2806 [Deltaproteobacteria bacterium]|nr:hypothetical protein [Deltaproteobacteria bacterium]